MSDDIIKRLRDAIAEHPLSPIHGYAADIAALLDRLDAAERERDSKAAELANLQVAFSDWKVFHSTARLEAENERLRAERDEHARWRVDLADKLHDAESQISAAWAALRRAGIQSEETVAEAIALLHAENERLHEDAERYRLIRRGQRWSVIDGIGDSLRAEQLDAAIDAARAAEQSDERRER